MSLGMFCAIPLPFHAWDDSCMNLLLACFPFIGLLLGVIWWGAAKLLACCGLHIMLASAVLTVVPFLLTGFMHLDGYMDTSDAVLSRRPLDDKLRILKDPHKGAFSVIMLATLFCLQFGASYALLDGAAGGAAGGAAREVAGVVVGDAVINIAGKLKNPIPLIYISVISRCCASIALLCLDVMPQSGFANMFRQNVRAPHKWFVVAAALATGGAAFYFSGFGGLVAIGAVIFGFAGAMAYSYKEFKGVSGDLAGFSLVIGELCGLIALAAIF